jgi:hypothetical protein
MLSVIHAPAISSTMWDCSSLAWHHRSIIPLKAVKFYLLLLDAELTHDWDIIGWS